MPERTNQQAQKKAADSLSESAALGGFDAGRLRGRAAAAWGHFQGLAAAFDLTLAERLHGRCIHVFHCRFRVTGRGGRTFGV